MSVRTGYNNDEHWAVLRRRWWPVWTPFIYRRRAGTGHCQCTDWHWSVWVFHSTPRAHVCASIHRYSKRSIARAPQQQQQQQQRRPLTTKPACCMLQLAATQSRKLTNRLDSPRRALTARELQCDVISIRRNVQCWYLIDGFQRSAAYCCSGGVPIPALYEAISIRRTLEG